MSGPERLGNQNEPATEITLVSMTGLLPSLSVNVPCIPWSTVIPFTTVLVPTSLMVRRNGPYGAAGGSSNCSHAALTCAWRS